MDFTTSFTIIAYFLRDIIMCLSYLSIGKNLFGGKIKKNIPVTIGLGLAFLANAICGVLFLLPLEADGYGVSGQGDMETLSLVLFIVALLSLLSDVRKGKLILFIIVFNGIIDTLIQHIQNYMPFNYFAETVIYAFIFLILAITIQYLAKSTTVNVLPELMSIMPKWMPWALLVFCFSSYYDLNDVRFESVTNFLHLLSTIGIIMCIAYFSFKIFHLIYQQNEILKQLHEQKEFSEKMLTGDENLRKFRHDYRNHMIVINALLESGRTDRAREYLNNMNSSIDSSLRKISTGNFISDAIINTKAIAAAGKETSIQFSGQIPATGIQDDDLCTVLANLIDNALEALEKATDNKTVHIEAAVKNEMFLFDISNPVFGEVKIKKDGTIKTSKSNQREHGYGMKNV